MFGSPSNKGLSNPALIAAAASPAGQKAIGTAVEKSVDLLFSILKVAAFLGVGFYVLKTFSKPFVKMPSANNLDPANITAAQAAVKAQQLLDAMKGFGADIDRVFDALNGLNYNGFVLVYNAFGLQDTAIPGQDPMNLTEWLQDQFGSDEEDMAKIRLAIGEII